MHLQTTTVVLLVIATGALAIPLPHEREHHHHDSRSFEEDSFELAARSPFDAKKWMDRGKIALKAAKAVSAGYNAYKNGKRNLDGHTEHEHHHHEERALEEDTSELVARSYQEEYHRQPHDPRSLEEDSSELVARSHGGNGGNGKRHHHHFSKAIPDTAAATDLQERDLEEDAFELTARSPFDAKKWMDRGQRAIKAVKAGYNAYKNGKRELDGVGVEARDGLMEIDELD